MRGRGIVPIALALALVAPACRGGGTRMGIPTTTEPPGLTRVEGILTVGGSVVPDPPFTVVDPTGAVSGFEVDLLDEIAARLGLTVERVDRAPDTLTAQLALGTVDLVAAALPVEDSDTLAFSRPYFGSGDDPRLGFAMEATATDLAGQVDTALEAMLVDGTYQTIYDTWFDDPSGSVLYVAPAALPGSEERPLRIYAVPAVDPRDILDGLRHLARSLEDATGLAFEVSVPIGYQETVDAVCAFPEESIGLLSPEAVVVALEACGADPAVGAVRLGETATRTMFVAARASGITGLADLHGRTWAHPGIDSLTGDLVPAAMLAAAGVTPGREVVTGSHAAAVLAVYTGEADFATVWFSPAVDKDRATLWDGTVEGADVADDLLWSCATISTGELVCADGYRPRDARITLRDEARDVIQLVGIVALSGPIPYDALVFGREVSADIRAAVIEAFTDFATDDPRGFQEALDALGWHGATGVTAGEYAGVAAMLEILGRGIDDL